MDRYQQVASASLDGGCPTAGAGEFLRGEHTHRIDVLPHPPANLFWSITIRDAETASGVDAEGQDHPSPNWMNDVVGDFVGVD